MPGAGRLVTAATLAGLLAACSSSADEPVARTSSPTAPSTAPSTARTSAAASCRTAVRHGPLPVWARTGFEPADQPVRYVIGERRTIVGVVFGYPLVAGTRQDGRGNKILWVGKSADGSDLPRPGCWTLDLSWGSGHDRMAVPYTS